MKYGYKWVTGFGLVILALCLSLVFIAVAPSPAKAQGTGRTGGWHVWWCDNYWGCGNYYTLGYINYNQGTGDGYSSYALTYLRWPGADNGVAKTIWFRTGNDDGHQLRINNTIVTSYGGCCEYQYGYYTAKPGEIVKVELWTNNYGGGGYVQNVIWAPDGVWEFLGGSDTGLQSTVDGGGSYWYTSEETSLQAALKTLDRARVAALAQGNRLYLNQSGSNPTVDIIQEGTGNAIQGRYGVGDAQLIGNFNTLQIRQGDSMGTGRNLIELDVNGAGNTITLLQGWNGTWPNVSKDGVESGGHFIDLKVSGNTNSVHFNQTNAGGSNSGHYNRTEITGSTNTVNVNQAYGANAYHTFYATITGNSNYVNVNQAAAGAQYMDLILAGSGHTVNASQTGSGSHKATINLTNVLGASTLNLTQQGAVSQTYSINQACANLSGCSVTVTQGTP